MTKLRYVCQLLYLHTQVRMHASCTRLTTADLHLLVLSQMTLCIFLSCKPSFHPLQMPQTRIREQDKETILYLEMTLMNAWLSVMAARISRCTAVFYITVTFALLLFTLTIHLMRSALSSSMRTCVYVCVCEKDRLSDYHGAQDLSYPQY